MIYVMEQIVVQSGKTRQYIEDFLTEYVPMAERRGMKLVQLWISPPIEMINDTNEVIVLFTIDGVKQFWQSRKHSRDPEVLAWWDKAAKNHDRRIRKFLKSWPLVS